MAKKLILCLDFDGVIHAYTSGFQGIDTVGDPPTEGALNFLREANKHFVICIYSTRSAYKEGRFAMQKWLSDAFVKETGQLSPGDLDLLYEIQWPTAKPPAHISIDDRAIQFTGEWPDPKALLKFKPWNQKDSSKSSGSMSVDRLGILEGMSESSLQDRISELENVLLATAVVHGTCIKCEMFLPLGDHENHCIIKATLERR